MKLKPGQTVLLTGASGGLGSHLAPALAARGLNLMLTAFPGIGLEELRQTVARHGVQAHLLAADLREPGSRQKVVEETLARFGRVDLLINNAGIELTAYFHTMPEPTVRDILAINLESAMLLTRLILPGMLERGSGHVLNISSLAGKSGPALQEPYAATKAGLVGFTAALRSSYRRRGVSASVLCPGFVDTGIYARLRQRSGRSAPELLGAIPPDRVVRGALRAIEGDRPEVILSRYPIRPLLAVAALFPRLGEWLIERTGANDFFRSVEEPPGPPR
jgi:short-subunit dehydrogenase